MKATLIRTESTEQGTFGSLLLGGKFLCFTVELPWKENQRQISCIPAGTYDCEWVYSPKFGYCYAVKNVQHRSSILLHKGNFAGDVSLGYKSNSHGCLLPALKLGRINNQKAGLLSGPAVATIAEVFQQKPFILEIQDAYNLDDAA